MTIVEIILLALCCVAIISNWINAKNIDRLEKRVHLIQIECEEMKKKYAKLRYSLKRVKRKLY